jgi:hypothetical protein
MSKAPRTKAQLAGILQRSELFNSGEWFDCYDMAKLLDITHDKARGLATTLCKDRVLDRLHESDTRTRIIQYRKRSLVGGFASMSWRKRSNAKLGIKESYQFGVSV